MVSDHASFTVAGDELGTLFLGTVPAAAERVELELADGTVLELELHGHPDGWIIEAWAVWTTRLRFATAIGAVNYEWSIAPDTKLVEESAINADLQSGSNWRASNTLTVNVTLTRILSLKASHAIEYRHVPVAGFGRSDHRGAIALVVSMEQRPKLP
jgi:hypothetical protein